MSHEQLYTCSVPSAAENELAVSDPVQEIVPQPEAKKVRNIRRALPISAASPLVTSSSTTRRVR
jgi:hypothetical protein